MDAGTITSVAFAGIAVFGAVLTALALAAVRRAPSPRMGLVATGFLLITLQGLVVGVGLLTTGWEPSTLLLISAVFEAALLVVLFVATLVR
jgi:ABC-type Fe3+ transport system permease subunit